MSTFKSAWKPFPFALLKEPYNLNGDVIALYSYLLDEYEYWSTKDENGYCPAQSTLAKVMNKTDKTIRNYLTALRKVGLIETKLRYDKTAVYVVKHFEHLNKPPDEQPTSTPPPTLANTEYIEYEWKEGDPVPF